MNIVNGRSITERIVNVLQKCVSLSDEQLNPANWQNPLTGFFYGLSVTDMVYFFLELEEEFDIRISSESLMDYGFSCIDKISRMIQEKY